MSTRTYLLDGDPVTAGQLIEIAKVYDPDFGADGFLQTSVAARILRGAGYTVEENKGETP